VSNVAITWAWRLRPVGDGLKSSRKLSPGAKLVLLRLADAANDDFVCWPGQKLLADETGFSERTVGQHIELLEELGLLSRKFVTKANGARLGTQYTLLVGRPAPNVKAPADDSLIVDGSPGEDSSGGPVDNPTGLSEVFSGSPVSNRVSLPAVSSGRAVSNPDFLPEVSSVRRPVGGDLPEVSSGSPVGNSGFLPEVFSGGRPVGDDLPEVFADLPEDSSGALKIKPQSNPQDDSSSSVFVVTTEAVVDNPVVELPGDDDCVSADFGWETAPCLRQLHPKLDLRALVAKLARLRPGLNPVVLDLPLAAGEIIAGARRPVGDAVAYVATAIAAEPGRWVRPEHLLSSAGSALCASLGHQWVGDWQECCVRCDCERPGWKEDRYGQEQRVAVA